MSNGSPFLLGPLGAMQRVELDPGVTRTVDRGGSELTTVGGVRYVQKARYAPRTWDGGLVWQSPSAVRLIEAAAQDLLGDVWLLDEVASKQNMLAAHQVSGAGAAVLVDGLPLGGLSAGSSVQVRVLAGRTYTVSAWSSASAGATVLTYKPGAGAVSNVLAPAGSGVRVAAASFTSATNQALTVTVPSAGVSGLRVHEGAADGKFFTGQGTPCRVSVEDPDRTLQMVRDGAGLSDYTVTLQEVGIPGSV